MIRLFLLFNFSIIGLATFAQDSAKVFYQQDLFWYLKNYHPISKQAELQVKIGQNEIRKSKGSFDPMLFSSFSEKEFKELEYYKLFSGGLKIPTWFGVDLNAGYDQNLGYKVNPEKQTATEGLSYAGFSIPIGQGLMFDKRRAAVQKANLFAQSTYIDQQLMLNDLYYNASKSYLNWLQQFNQMKLFQNAVGLSRDRFQGVKQSFLGGDLPAIDTLEAYILLQVRELNFNQAQLDFQNAKLDLSNYLWFENNVPLEIGDSLVPPTTSEIIMKELITLDSLNSLISNLKFNHPQLILYDLKLKELEVEKRWNLEQLKPVVQLKYNFLNETITQREFSGFSPNNYTWGFDFSFPIFLREGRGKLSQTKLKIQQTKWDVDIKLVDLSNKIKSYFNDLTALRQQITLFESASNNYAALLDAEKQKFDMGESSIFLVNTRESNYIQAAQKLIELKVKYQSKLADFNYSIATWSY